MIEWIIPFITLATLEIVLGIDNLVFLAIVTARLPEAQRPLAPLRHCACLRDQNFAADGFSLVCWENDRYFLATSIRDLVLIGGGTFLLVKAAMEINSEITGVSGPMPLT